MPAVQAVAIAQAAPFAAVSNTRVKRAGARPGEVYSTIFNAIMSPSYFRALGIELRRGRLFEAADIGQPGARGRQVVILSENLARKLFGEQEAVGQLIEFPVRGREQKAYEVIGVVANTRFSELFGETETVLYEPMWIDGAFRSLGLAFLVRSINGEGVAGDIRAIGKGLNSALPLGEIQPLERVIAAQRRDWTVLGNLMSAFAVLAALLAALGLYGVVSFAVAQRRREFGVRVALGATPGTIVRLVVRHVGAVCSAGLLFGGLGAVALARALESRLVGVDKFDPWLWSIAAAGMCAVALLASILPIRRATRSDVTQALRTL